MKILAATPIAPKKAHEPQLSSVQADVLAGLASGGRLEVPTFSGPITLYAKGGTREVKRQPTFERLQNLKTIVQTEQHDSYGIYRITIWGGHVLSLHRERTEKSRGRYPSLFTQEHLELRALYTRWKRWIQMALLASRYADQALNGAEFLRRVRLIQRAEGQAQRAGAEYQRHCDYHGAILRDLVTDSATKFIPGQSWEQLPTIILMRVVRKVERDTCRSGDAPSVNAQKPLLQVCEELRRRADWGLLQSEQKRRKASHEEIHLFFAGVDEQ